MDISFPREVVGRHGSALVSGDVGVFNMALVVEVIRFAIVVRHPPVDGKVSR